jgi:hypothetical protein
LPPSLSRSLRLSQTIFLVSLFRVRREEANFFYVLKMRTTTLVTLGIRVSNSSYFILRTSYLQVISVIKFSTSNNLLLDLTIWCCFNPGTLFIAFSIYHLSQASSTIGSEVVYYLLLVKDHIVPCQHGVSDKGFPTPLPPIIAAYSFFLKPFQSKSKMYLSMLE